MINVRLEQITTERLQAIQTTEDSEFLTVSTVNAVSNPFLCILETDTPMTTKLIGVFTVNESIYLASSEVEFIGTFDIAKNKQTYLVFEIKSASQDEIQ